MLLLFNDFLKDLLYESSHFLDLTDPSFAIGFKGFCRMSRLYVFTLKPAFEVGHPIRWGVRDRAVRLREIKSVSHN